MIPTGSATRQAIGTARPRAADSPPARSHMDRLRDSAATREGMGC